MIKTIFKTLGVLLLVGYLAAAGWTYGFWRSEPTYRGILIDIEYPNEVAHFVSESDIRTLVQQSQIAVRGRRFDEVNTLALSQYIEEHNRLVLRASCYHTPDSLLRIDIEQRTPIMRLMSEHPKVGNAYLDKTGSLMPCPRTITPIHLPLATGYITPEQLPELKELAHYLKRHDFWGRMVTQIDVRPNHDITLVPRVGNHVIVIGHIDKTLDDRLDRVRTFYNKVLPRRGWNAYREINVKFDGQVVARK